jgi:tRNA pseudouridine38-40 synthase
VHALGQIAAFDANFASSDISRLMLSLNALLPDQIKVMAIREVPTDFHPIRNSTGKLYTYNVWRGRFSNPFWAPYCWPISFKLNVELMLNCCRQFVGELDFAAFCAADSGAKTSVRRIELFDLSQVGDRLIFTIQGTGFLKQMCRSMVGTLIDVGRGKLPPDSIPKILASRDHTCAGQTAPAGGLCLSKVFYQIGGVQHSSGSQGLALPQ